MFSCSHPLLYCTKCTSYNRDHFTLQFSYATLYVFLVLGLCTYFSFRFPLMQYFYLMKQSNQSVYKWHLLNLSLRKLICSLLYVVLSVLTAISHRIVMLLSELRIRVSSLCSYHLFVTSIS